MADALEGMKVLDMSRFIAGPYCAMILGDMGAEVVKIEKPGEGELCRGYQPEIGGNSVYAMMFNRNKLGLSLDLRKPEGLKILKDLVASADVLIENFRPGTMEKMGCSWEELSAINPRLIMARVSGFGQDGPFAAKPCFDVIAQAMSGLMDLTGDPDGPPSVIGTYICDYVTALYTTIGILGAIKARDSSGRGQVVDVALLNSAVSLLTTAIPERLVMGTRVTRRGNHDRFGPPTASYRTADGGWVYVTAGTLFPRFAMAIGRPELLDDPRYATFKARHERTEELEAIAAEWFGRHLTAEALAILAGADVPCTKIANIDDVVSNPQLRHRGQIVDVPVPGGATVPMQGVTIHLSETPLTIRRGLPDVGAHSESVLQAWLGYSPAEIEELQRSGTI